MADNTQIKVLIRIFLQDAFKKCSENNKRLLIDSLTEPLCQDIANTYEKDHKISMKDIEDALVRYLCNAENDGKEVEQKHVKLTHPRCTAIKPFK